MLLKLFPIASANLTGTELPINLLYIFPEDLITVSTNL